MDHPSKRFKPESRVVDLTLSSDDSDDDIIITEVRQVANPQTPRNIAAEPLRPALPPQLQSFVNSYTGFPRLSEVGGPASGLPQAAAHASVKVDKESQGAPTTTLAYHNVPAVKREDSGPFVKTENTGIVQHASGVLEVNRHFFKSQLEVTYRENELASRLRKYERALQVLAHRKTHRPEKLIQLKTKRDQLLRMGISPENIKIMSIVDEMKKLSGETREHAEKEKKMKAYIEKSKAKLNYFLRNEKPVLVSIFQQREQAARERRLMIEAERRRRLQEQVDRQMRIIIGDDEEEEEEDGGQDSFFMRRVQELEARQQQRYDLQRNQASLNQYTTNTEDLIHLLESVKKQEEQEVDGESNTPDELLINLLKHQRIGLKWMEDSEDDKKKRGGILADAMGLGKTVQMLALMMSHKAEKNQDEDVTEYGKTTLIVAPVSLINQWKGEIETKVKEAVGLTIFMFHNIGSRKISWSDLKNYDIVMTSYGTLSSELGKHCRMDNGTEVNLKQPPNLNRINQLKSGEDYVSPFFGPDSKFYRVVLDEAQQIKNKFTKVSVSAASLSSYYRWCLSGTPMQNKVDELYPLLRFLKIRPYNSEQRFKDEISNRLRVNDKRNDEMDSERAIKMLRILLRSIMLRREKNSTIDGKPILDLPEKSIVIKNTLLSSNKNEENFYRSIEESSAAKVQKILGGPIAKGDYSYIFVLLLRLRQACLHSELVRIGDRKKGVMYDEEGNVISTATVDSMCKNAEKFKPEVVRRINEATESGVTCPICHDDPPLDQLVLFFPCGHGLCKECCGQFFENFQEGVKENVRISKCITCRMPVKENELVDYEVFDKRVTKDQSVPMIRLAYEEKRKNNRDALETLNSLKVENLEFSPKVADTIALLREIWEKDPDDKVIIFSHFTSFFSILNKFLARENIECLEYLGSMNAQARDEVVKEFYRNDSKKLMLISLKAGNSGLTLTCANHVIIMDPFWNPYVEAQAQDRCHRIGQQKPVTVHRMLIKDTVEDRILQLQKRKEDLIESALDPTGMKEASKLSREDIANLFGIGRRQPME